MEFIIGRYGMVTKLQRSPTDDVNRKIAVIETVGLSIQFTRTKYLGSNN